MYRYALPTVRGRGAGLGNELFGWGKAFVAAEALGLKPLHPAWGLNARGYRSYFQTSTIDWAVHACLRASLPRHNFGPDEYIEHGGGQLSEALLKYGQANDLFGERPLLIEIGGMWGGFKLIEESKQFLLSQLLTSNFTQRNLFVLQKRFAPGKLRVGFHVRLGDFEPEGDMSRYRGTFNKRIPLEWYCNIATKLSQAFGDTIEFLLVSDGNLSDLSPLTERQAFIDSSDQDHRDISDLIALSLCDLIVCSISTYSLWSVFFSEGRYLWFAPNLQEHYNGLQSIWGHEADQRMPQGETSKSLKTVSSLICAGARLCPRGIPIELTGELPQGILEWLDRRGCVSRPSTDLVLYGAAPPEVSG
jgi:hypothetical protein